MARARLHAIAHVHLDAPSGVEPQVRAFYGELIGLPVVDALPGEQALVCFGANRMSLRLVIRRSPRVEPMRRRLTLEVESLDDLAARLAEAGIAFRTVRGLYFTDRRIYCHDPIGHLVEFKETIPL